MCSVSSGKVSHRCTLCQQTFFAKNAENIEHAAAENGSIAQEALETLARSGMIQRRRDGSIKASDAGLIMSQSYVDFATMKGIIKIGATTRPSYEDLLVMLCGCSEVRISMRRQERNELNHLNASTMFRVANPDGSRAINSDEAKTNILIQAILNRSTLGNSHLEHEANQAIEEAKRILAGEKGLPLCASLLLTSPNVSFG
jgi:replicative superfamily II helicase